MTKKREDLAGMPPAEAAEFALNNDLGDLFDEAEVVRERRPAKMVTTLRLDLDIQAELEAAAGARGIGSSTLMRQIIEEWVAAHRGGPVPNQFGELVRHLDAARQAAASLAREAAA
ncbi:ribbon-helix-helix protein, CopG family [Dactylosporangium sp. CA-233914]|uniref:ribbon-helix-helix protein, CopG family n=1 Tax=Dactylosporangium sp. CA-233914 TaxID=3239934 RepID=UPI003D93E5C2